MINYNTPAITNNPTELERTSSFYTDLFNHSSYFQNVPKFARTRYQDYRLNTFISIVLDEYDKKEVLISQCCNDADQSKTRTC